VNAWLCFAKLPVAVNGNPKLHWDVIPAGALHGAILAASSFAMAETVKNKRVMVQLALATPVAWVAGYASWVPLGHSVFSESWSEAVLWPFDEGIKALWAPVPYFGLVALCYYLCLCFRRRRDGLPIHIGAGTAAGVFGSLWWWIEWEPWYFSLVHGTLWGVLVGFGAWRATAAARLGAHAE
jgi:hypothetical protein